MIERLVKSALQTGCLSVASESLLRQILEMKGWEPSELEVLNSLEEALSKGEIEREAQENCHSILSHRT
ncbi:MAG: hypothetical protein F6K24_47205 [Okeania sp. SIO2D1]|nr:hypothetical protein [Okeania sp. SIO2D1]